MSIFPRINQRTKILLPIRTNTTTYNLLPEHTIITENTFIPSVEDGPTVIARYRNLTIGAGATITTSHRCCGLVVVVDGDLTVNGTLSMTARGANLAPSDGYKIKNDLFPARDMVYEIDIPATAEEIAAFLIKEKRRYHSFDEIPAIYRPTFVANGGRDKFVAEVLGEVPISGASGGEGSTGNGMKGADGVGRGTGGGGSGGRYSSGTSGAGAAGTCYSGGSAGGAVGKGTGGRGAPFGGKGGDGVSDSGYSVGSGAGNPAGTPRGGSSAASGTGGLLVVLCTGKIKVSNVGAIVCNGSNGGYGPQAGGGGSGGGSLNLFYSLIENEGLITAAGGAGGGGSSGSTGGKGGNGTVSLDQYNF